MAETASHADLMNRTYRYQRLFYDATRRYYLLGRDRAVCALSPPVGGSVLEIACGTGRNLARIGRRDPGCTLYGLDISQEMLRSARSKLSGRARLALADACEFDAPALFGRDSFDRVLLSYSLSMIPDWQSALQAAAKVLGPGGELHVVDFGQQLGYPSLARRGLHAWLGKFHVTPRRELEAAMRTVAARHGLDLQFETLYLDYARYGVLRRRSF